MSYGIIKSRLNLFDEDIEQARAEQAEEEIRKERIERDNYEAFICAQGWAEEGGELWLSATDNPPSDSGTYIGFCTDPKCIGLYGYDGKSWDFWAKERKIKKWLPVPEWPVNRKVRK